MRFNIDPGFQANAQEPRYYSRWLEKWEQGWRLGRRWELRIIGVSARSNARIEFGPGDSLDAIQREFPIAITEPVLRAALAGNEGYLTDGGEVTDGQGRELSSASARSQGDH